MPRFPVAFSRRKSSVDNTDHASVTGPSFRVLDRSELSNASKNSDPDHAPRPPTVSRTMPSHFMSDSTSGDDNIFADLKNDQAYSNAFNIVSTDANGQQHQHFQYQESKHAFSDVPPPPVPKPSFLKSAGRTFSFGQKKPPSYPHIIEESVQGSPQKQFSRDRAATSSTTSTATPPKLEEGFSLDLGGDFSKVVGGFDKRGSAIAAHEGSERLALAPRSLTGNRLNQPTPIQVDLSTKVEPSPYSWGSHASNDGLLNSSSNGVSLTNENTPPPVPRHVTLTDNSSEPAAAANRTLPASGSAPVLSHQAENGLRRSSAIFGRRRSTIDTTPEPEAEDTVLLRDSFSAVSKFLTGGDNTAQTSAGSSNRFRRNEDSPASGYKQLPTEGSPVEDSLFDLPLSHPVQTTQRAAKQPPAQAETKVMTPEQFERYRKDKELETTRATLYMEHNDANGNDEDNYEEDEDEDEAEKLRRAAKQRRKQEAHMTVYRQQMMKVTGEAASGTPTQSSMHISASTPNLTSINGGAALGVSAPTQQGASDGSDDDEEVPLAILAAHGFPNKNRPPTRLSTMMSNPNLRAATGPSYQRPGSAMGDAPNGSSGRLPPFARNLPQDPYGLVSPPIRESLHFGAGSPASVPPGGLVGVIANEERSRAMRRGSPAVDSTSKPLPPSMTGLPLDPMAGIPPHMMYPGMVQPQMLSAGEQAQIQMTQQMQQFMQMQMQFMQMMANSNPNANGMNMTQGPEGQYPNFGAMGMNPAMNGAGLNGGGLDTMRHSFVDNGSVMDFSGQRQDTHMRTMSMVQPSSASWVQPLGAGMGGGYTPSIRVQGANGYAPSIAPSERSNVGLPGRYRPVSHVPAASQPSDARKSVAMTSVLGTTTGNAAMSNGSSTPGTISPGWDNTRKQINRSPLNNSANVDEDDDDEQGWAAMKEKREKKRSIWKSKKIIGTEIGALIS